MPVPKTSSTLDRMFAVALTLFLGYYFVIRPVQKAWSNYWLVKDGREGTAIVMKALWTGHNVVRYRYSVNQKEYTGQDFRSWQDAKSTQMCRSARERPSISRRLIHGSRP